MSGNMKLQALTALLGAVGVAAAAFGAHGLEKIATPEQVSWWTTGVAMHLVTLPVVLLVAVKPEKLRLGAGVLLMLGVFIFCGSLYSMALGAPRWFGAITPLGGLALIAGWLLLAAPPREPDQ